MDVRPDIFKGAYRLVTECANVESNEEVLVVTDTASLKYGEAIMSAALTISKNVNLMVTPLYGRLHSQEPSPTVASAMKVPDVLFMPTRWSMSHCQARREASDNGVRALAIPQVDDELFAETIANSPFGEVKEVVMTINQMFSEADEAKVTTPAGTNLWMSLKGRNNRDLEHGWLHKGLPEYSTNFAAPPCVEANIAPIEGTAQGTIVVDVSQSVVGLVHDPITLTVENGRIVRVEGKQEASLLKMRLEEAGDPDIYMVAELGLGLNPIAKVRNQFIDDESAYGTGHIGTGNNASLLGGNIAANGHFDNIFWYPTIELDGREIMKDGRLVSKDLPKLTGHYIK